MKTFYKLIFISFISVFGCDDEGDLCIINSNVHKATAEISYDLSTWSSSEAVYNSFRVVDDTEFIEIKFNYYFPDNINGESLRFYIPLPEVGDVFYFPDGPIPSIFSDSLVPSFQFFTTEIDLITEYYELNSFNSMRENFISISTIDDCQNISGEFNLNFKIDSASMNIFPRERPDVFSFSNGSFIAFNNN